MLDLDVPSYFRSLLDERERESYLCFRMMYCRNIRDTHLCSITDLAYYTVVDPDLALREAGGGGGRGGLIY